MHLHEYQSKTVLQEYGIVPPPFAVASTMEEVEAAIRTLNLTSAVLKVQIHAGGRGKAGGVILAKTKKEILEAAKKLIGMKIVNKQTGPRGIVASQILISPLVPFQKEYYLGATIDRKKAQAVLIGSAEGGTEIEELAVTSPDLIMSIPIQSNGTVRTYHQVEMVKFMGWTGQTAEQGKKIIQSLAKAFVCTDASLVEINPLVLTSSGDLVALDAKISIDDNALYRQPKLLAFDDPSQLPVHEAKAKEHDLAYIALDGTIGCMVNGAGLAMATMDIIHYYGGSPANFLDVGGGASEDKIAEGFKIILSDPNVKAILINIFGGIMNCATLAAGIITATLELKIHVPLIVRMEGTNVEEGKKILKDSGLTIILADALDDAAQKAVAASKGGRNGNSGR